VYALQGICVSGLVVLLAMVVARWANAWPALQGFLVQQPPGRLLSRGLFFFILLAVGAEWLVKGLRKLHAEHRAAKAAVYSKDEKHADAYKQAADKAQAELLAVTEEALRREAEERAIVARQAAELLAQEQCQRKLDEGRLRQALAERAEKDAEEAAAVREEVRGRRALRAEQDWEYQDALQRDRARARKEAEELERKEQLRREEMESVEFWKRQLPEEPPAGTVGVATIRLKLRDSAPLTRRFLVMEDVALLRAWVKTSGAVKPGDDSFKLVTLFPRKELPSSGEALEALGLFPQAIIAVELP